jgi:hypothetical protein
MSLLNYNQFILNESAVLEEILNEGGAYGHLAHPFEDMGLTMGDLKKMIDTTVNGAFGPENFVQEKCLTGDSIVNLEHRGNTRIDELVNHKYEDNILSQDLFGNTMYQPIMDWVNHDETEEWLAIETEDGKKLLVTPNHRIFANGVDIKAEDLAIGDSLVVI